MPEISQHSHTSPRLTPEFPHAGQPSYRNKIRSSTVFIKRDGTLQVGRPLMDGGAHAVGYNEKSVGVCMAGGLAEDGKTAENNFTEEQWDTLAEIVSELLGKFPNAKVIGHNDVAAKACPCFDVKTWWYSAPNQ